MLPGIQLNQRSRKIGKREAGKVERTAALGSTDQQQWEVALSLLPHQGGQALCSRHVHGGESQAVSISCGFFPFAMDQHRMEVHRCWIQPQALAPAMKALDEIQVSATSSGPISAHFALGKREKNL